MGVTPDKRVVIDPPFLFEVPGSQDKRGPKPRKLASSYRKSRQRASRDGWLHGRAAATDGAVLVMGLDETNGWVSRCLDLIAAHLSDIGGIANASVGQQSLIRRIAGLTVELEYLEGQFARAGHAEPNDLQLYATVAGRLHKMLETLGFKRIPKDVTGTPRLADLLSREIAIEAKEQP